MNVVIQEAGNARAYAVATRGNNAVHVPIVYSDLSSARMLTMEWVDGVKVTLLLLSHV